MRFLIIYKPDHRAPCGPENMEEMEKRVDEAMKSGALLATGGLVPEGVKVRRKEGAVTITDGPYAEAKEMVAGFALFELESMEVAVESSKDFLRYAGDGECEIRPLMEGSRFADRD
ncbi:hypothetical protein H7849_21170 [Alloacidobacterium dinghuense]|uniref:YCII-related domain-containing protein n=1 Tax=Alloacidobacterium dinghuense TaxID=2763107 RepID=A0A7G8BG86_9BACT|nr:YciI family protein [Alloacidobacterium dinghuense]QNI31556.1 hypothetical protein H7849_21170 [Alloacidobacterium dinghuense]